MDNITPEVSFTEEYQTFHNNKPGYVIKMLKNNLLKSNLHHKKSLPASPPPSLASIQEDSIGNHSSMNQNKNTEETMWDIMLTQQNNGTQLLNPNKPNLKLNLSRLGQYDSLERAQAKSEGGGGFYSSEPIGFHQEFMAKIDEFSLSWRQAAMKEKKL